MTFDNEGFCLSSSQENILSLEARYPGTSINVICATIGIKGRLDFAILSRTVNKVLQADPCLRTRILRDGEVFSQKYAPYEPQSFPVMDFSQTDDEGFSRWEEAVAREPFTLFNSPLINFYFFRRGGNSGGIVVKTHHICFDGWSLLLLCNRIAEAYLTMLGGLDYSPAQSPGYENHIAGQREYLESRACKRDAEYWAKTLATEAQPASFKDQKGAVLSAVGARRSFKLSEGLNNAIYTFCKERQVSPFAPYYMALAIAARRMGGDRCFIIGVPVHNRTDLVARETTGMFVSTLPLLCEIDESWTAEEFNDYLGENWLELLRHQRYPYELIQQLPGKSGRLFNIALSYQDNLTYKSGDASVNFSGRWTYSGYQAEQLCIHLTNLEDNRRYTVDYDYLTQLFTDSEIESLHNTICSILEQLLRDGSRPLRDISIISGEDRERVLYKNNSSAAPRTDGGLWESFYARAAEHPRRTAYIFDGARTSYEELCKRAISAGRVIADVTAASAPLTAVFLPRCGDLCCAMFGAIAAGGAWLLIPPETPRARAFEIIRSSGAEVLVTSRNYENIFAGNDFELPVLYTEDIFDAPPGDFTPGGDEGGLAYVVYTSGSTGRPKGVEISRRNLMNFAAGMRHSFDAGAILSVATPSFDAFVLECAASILNGLTVVFASESEQENPEELAGLIRSYGVHFMCMTPSRLGAYLECEAFRGAISCCKGILCGGEAFGPELLTRLKCCTDAKIYNQYGPSETTVGVSLARLDDGMEITAGAPMENCALYVLDDRLEPLPTGVFGELYIGGDSVGPGYRNAPELTEKSFMANPFVFGGRMYRTGDVAAWNKDGKLILRGRLDRQLKLRGQRAEPEELALCLRGYPGVTAAAVRPAELSGQTVLFAYYTADAPIAEAELMHHAAERLPLYLLPAGIRRLEAMPMTASGKIDENRLPLPEINSGSGRGAANKSEADILSAFRRVLKSDDIRVEDDYFLRGGNSLNAMETLSILEDGLGIRLRVSDLYACRTAANLSRFLAGGATGDSAGLPMLAPAPKRDYYPVSDMQKNIFFQSALNPGAMAYNMPGAFKLGSRLDPQRLENAFRRLIEDDDLYRSAFSFVGGELCAKILPEIEFKLGRLSADSLENAFSQFLKPFDLAAPPLIRAALWENEGDEYLFVDVHHIVGDGVSTPIMLSRLDAYYRGDEGQKPFLTYKDYCCYRETLDSSQALADWAQHLAPVPEKLDLPTDMPRPHPFDFKGGKCVFTLPPALSAECRELCARAELTPFMLFTAAFGLLLSRISGRKELLIGTPVAGRSRSELWEICGPFLSSLPMRICVEDSVSGYLESVKREVLWMLDHQELPLDRVLNELELEREAGDNALYSVMLSYRPLDVNTLAFNGERAELFPAPHSTAKAELHLEAAESGEGFSFVLEYACSLFKKETAEFYGRCFEAILDSIARGAENLSEVSLMLPEDKLRLTDEPNEMAVPFRNAPVDALIFEAASRRPEAAAIIFGDAVMTFRELSARVLALAGQLQLGGAVPGDNIGLCCRRTPDMICALLAILKCGCAYVPFLPDFPEKRAEYMMEIAGVKLILGDESAPKAVGNAKTLVMDHSAPQFTAPKRRGGLMYILFTSGSTGRPKGVMVTQRAGANYGCALRGILAGSESPVLCTSNMTFDIFQTESLIPLSMGRAVALCDQEERALPWLMAARMESAGAKTMQMTPSQMELCLNNPEFCKAVSHMELIILTGEASSSGIVEKLAGKTSAKLINLYGPTETTVYVSGGELAVGEPVSIGKPLQNCRFYVLDENMEPVMPTARGTLYVGGECLGAGYVGRDDLTEAAFLPDPAYPGELIYNTGDVVRQSVDGSYRCLGRADSQIKLNGLRIELEEINSAAVSTGLVTRCVTLRVEKGDGSAFLRAFAVPVRGQFPSRDELSRRMGLQLPQYMIPAEFIFLEKLPVNASGKVDLARLRENPRVGAMEAFARAAALPPELVPEVSPAQSSLSEDIARAIWQEALGREDISDVESFFRQGGTSLAALSILTSYFSHGVSMTLEEFYSKPTLKEQLGMIAASTHEKACPEPASPETRPAPSAAIETPALPADYVLLTGATGFLGVHLLRELLDGGKAQTVACLVRNGDSGRLADNIRYYFGDEWLRTAANRIDIVAGDITRERFGMSDFDYLRLCGKTQTVFNAAADVRHYASDGNSKTVNVSGTANVVSFCKSAGASLNHVSTLSVSGEKILSEPEREALFSEADFYIGQNFEDNIYVNGKFLAEKEIFDAVEDGLIARVYRLGRLVGRDSDGVFQKNPGTNAVFLTINGILSVGALPASMADFPMDFTPVDYCAKAIVALAQADMPVCHIMDPAATTMSMAIEALSPGTPLLGNMEFVVKLNELSRSGSAADVAPVIDILNRVIINGAAKISPDCRKTAEKLSALGVAPPASPLGLRLREYKTKSSQGDRNNVF